MRLLKSALSLLVIFSIAGCNLAPVNVKETIQIRQDSKLSQAASVREGEFRATVVARLGPPNTVVRLSGNRQIDHYYSDQLNLTRRGLYYNDHLERAKAGLPSRQEWQSLWRVAYFDRSLKRLEVFYENGKVVRQQGSSELFSIPGGEERLKSYLSSVTMGPKVLAANSEKVYQLISTESDPAFRESALWIRYTEPRVNGGFPFSVAEAKAISESSSVANLLWSLGTPSRILNTAKGEWFIYERMRFKREGDKLASFDLDRSAFLISYAKVVRARHKNKKWPVPDLSEVRSTFLFSNLPALGFIKSIDAHGSGRSTHNGLPHVMGDYYQGMWNVLSDDEFAEVAADTEATLQRISKNDIDEDLYLLRGASMRVGSVGGENLAYLVGNNKDLANRALSSSDAVWVNFLSPDKFYFDRDGGLDAVINFSAFTPHSPWYAFGPVTELLLGQEYDYGKCPNRTFCTRPLSSIFKNNLVVPWQ